MTDQLVSIRMPTSLSVELKTLVARNHYIDQSEQLRSIIRQKARRYLLPHDAKMTELRTRVETEIEHKNKQEQKEAILRELKKLLLEVDE